MWGKPKNINEISIEKEDEINVNLNSLDSIGSFNLNLILKDSLFSRIPYFNRQSILLKEKTPNIDWKISSESKKIGNFKCQKATCFFRGRNYIAWFTNDLPAKGGPWKLLGLPGLILSAVDDKNEIQFVATSISNSEIEINPSLTANRTIDLIQYKKIINFGPQDFLKKLQSKLPRNTKMTVDTKKSIEVFD